MYNTGPQECVHHAAGAGTAGGAVKERGWYGRPSTRAFPVSGEGQSGTGE